MLSSPQRRKLLAENLSGDSALDRNTQAFEQYLLGSVDALERDKVQKVIEDVKQGRDPAMAMSEFPDLDLEPKFQKELLGFLHALDKINKASPENLEREGLRGEYRDMRLDRAKRQLDHMINQRTSYDRASTQQSIDDPENFRWRK